MFSSLCDSILLVVHPLHWAHHRVVAMEMVGEGTVWIVKPMVFLSHKITHGESDMLAETCFSKKTGGKMVAWVPSVPPEHTDSFLH